MKLVWGSVERVTTEAEGIQHLEVSLDEGPLGKAICYPQLTGAVAASDRVLLNTTAVELALGTGGTHFVVARLGEARGVAHDSPSGGHIMKARYTPCQVDVMCAEAQECEHHPVMRDAVSLDGMPVVCCGLHSQVPLVAAAYKRMAPDATVAYCMTDQAALPLALSNLVRSAREVGLLDVTVSCGQAFGGDLEAINLHSGLLAARHVGGADVAIVAIGPGVAGTGTPFGHGGIAQGEALNAAGSLGGTPVACLRVSAADSRERHQGVSHHTVTALSAIALTPVKVAIPTLPAEISDAIESRLAEAGVWRLHERMVSVEGSVEPPSLRGLEVTTMGRGPHVDMPFFAAAYAAGEIAFRIAAGVLKPSK